MENVSLTDVVAVSPYFRLLNNIRARQKAIRWQNSATTEKISSVAWQLDNLARINNILLDIKYTNTKSWRYRVAAREFISLGNREKHLSDIFGYCLKISRDNKVDIVEKSLLDKLLIGNKQNRVKDLQTRILLEIIEACHDGWYVVFNTLTVTNNNMSHVFEKNGRAFEKYILSLNYAIKKETERKDGKKYKKTSDYHTYFAVVEEGRETGRLHFHVLHFCRYLPVGCSDPNIGRGIPDHRIIAGLRTYWKWGFSSPIAVRFNAGDNYARLGWRWPVKRIGTEFVAIESSNPLRMARYMSKYILKANQERVFTWRTRMTKGFGTKIIQDALTKIPDHLLPQLMMISHWRHLETKGISFPLSLTRKMAIRMFLLRKSLENSDTRISMTQKLMTRIKPQHSIVEQLRTLTQKRQRSNSRNISYIQTRSSRSLDIFEITQIFDQELGRRGYGKREAQARGVTRDV